MRELRKKEPKCMDPADLGYMAVFVSPAKTDYDIRKNPYIREICRRAGKLPVLLYGSEEAQQKAIYDANDKLGDCLGLNRFRKKGGAGAG